MKIANIIPRFKKNDRQLFDNYRPISILPAISKIFETIMFWQMTDYFNKFKLFTKASMVLESGAQQNLQS